MSAAPALLTELETKEFPAVYRRFASVIGEQHWRHRVSQIKASIKRNRFLADYQLRENSIAFALERCGDLITRYGGLPDESASKGALYPAMSFAGQVLSMMDLATQVEASRLCRRVQDTLKNPDNMRGYRLELGAATHFVRRGNEIKWPEMVSLGNFDLLVADLGNDGLEVECKSISTDKGRRIHRAEALEFYGILFPELAAIRKTLRAGVSVVLTLPARLPTRYQERVALAKTVRQQIVLARGAQLADGTRIDLAEFDLALLNEVAHDRGPVAARSALKAITRTDNREGVILGTDAGGALVFVIQSAQDDDFMDATFDTLRGAAKRQLTGTRPAILIAGFDDLTDRQLVSLAEQERDPQKPPTALAQKVGKFLSAGGRDHVVGVAFLSRSEIAPSADGLVDSGGSAYYFPKRASPLWHPDCSGLFGNTPYVGADVQRQLGASEMPNSRA